MLDYVVIESSMECNARTRCRIAPIGGPGLLVCIYETICVNIRSNVQQETTLFRTKGGRPVFSELLISRVATGLERPSLD